MVAYLSQVSGAHLAQHVQRDTVVGKDGQVVLGRQLRQQGHQLALHAFFLQGGPGEGQGCQSARDRRSHWFQEGTVSGTTQVCPGHFLRGRCVQCTELQAEGVHCSSTLEIVSHSNIYQEAAD